MDNAWSGGSRTSRYSLAQHRHDGEPMMSDAFEPRPEHRFTFGLWTVGNRGRDPFGHEVRPALDPDDAVHRLADLGAYGVSFHDSDLVPDGSAPAEREAIVKRFRRALDATGMKV